MTANVVCCLLERKRWEAERERARERGKNEKNRISAPFHSQRLNSFGPFSSSTWAFDLNFFVSVLHHHHVCTPTTAQNTCRHTHSHRYRHIQRMSSQMIYGCVCTECTYLLLACQVYSGTEFHILSVFLCLSDSKVLISGKFKEAAFVITTP